MSLCLRQNSIVMHDLLSHQIADDVSAVRIYRSDMLILASKHTGRAGPVSVVQTINGDIRNGDRDRSMGPHRSHLSLLFRHGSQLRILRERLVKGARSGGAMEVSPDSCIT